MLNDALNLELIREIKLANVAPVDQRTHHHSLRIQELITMSADVNFQDRWSESGLMLTKHVDIAQLLVAAGADLELGNRTNRTALSRACFDFFDDWSNHRPEVTFRCAVCFHFSDPFFGLFYTLFSHAYFFLSIKRSTQNQLFSHKKLQNLSNKI